MKEQFLITFTMPVNGDVSEITIQSKPFPSYQRALDIAVICMDYLPFSRFKIEKFYVL